jgi:mRNA-degrading endonuclease RelE of RelBE toxin-antitoxin system
MNSIKIEFSDRFVISVKRLAKRYRGLDADLKSFIESLKENPNQGVELFPHVRKIRMAISAKGKGKSGGARIITVNALATERDGTIILLLIYDKSETENVSTKIIKEVIQESGLSLNPF